MWAPLSCLIFPRHILSPDIYQFPNLNVNSSREGSWCCHHWVPSPLHEGLAHGRCPVSVIECGRLTENGFGKPKVGGTDNHSSSLFIQQCLSPSPLKHLVCASHCSRQWGGKQVRRHPCPFEVTFQQGTMENGVMQEVLRARKERSRMTQDAGVTTQGRHAHRTPAVRMYFSQRWED